MAKKHLHIPAALLESLQSAGVDPVKVLKRAAEKKDVALNTRIPSYLLKRIKESSAGNISERVRELLESGLAAEAGKPRKDEK